jgi:hypothetical protein
VEIGRDEALRVLETGESAGAKSVAAGKSVPFYNPHWLAGGRGEAAAPGGERLEAQKAFFARLLDVAKCYLFNSAVAGGAKIKETIGR